MTKLKVSDIQGLPPIIWNKDGIVELFALYEEMFIPYRLLQQLPQAPIIIDKRSSQVILREIIGYLCEEASEAITVMEQITEECYKPESDHKLIEGLFREYNEELADILHFLVKLLIYSNIDATSIKSYYLALTTERSLSNLYFPAHTLDTTFGIALFMNSMDGRLTYLGKEILFGRDETFLKAGTKVSIEILLEHKALMFEVIHNLNKACNTLKNKPWKQTETPTDIGKYQLYLMEAWLWLFKYYQFVGLDAQSLFSIFWYKNRLNLKRIEQKY